jgi:ribosome-associated toxin RatA of RatAB toxin-antitoxin module
MRPLELSRRTLFFATLLAFAGSASAASAEPSAVTKRLMKHQKAERYEVQTRLSSIRAGAARIAVRAPAATVKKVVLDYGHYADFIQRFEKSRVLGRHHGKADVYLQVPILRGAAKIWAVVRFEPPKKVHDGELIEAHMVRGNVKRLDAWWHIRPIDKDHTRLDLELLIVPKLPVPGSLVTGEVAYAADTAVTGSRDRAEHSKATRRRR